MRIAADLLTPFRWELTRTAPDTVTTVMDSESPVFAGHFPGRPVVPGVCLIDLVCQAAAMLGFVSAGPTLAVERARFASPALPGDALTITIAPAEPGTNLVLGTVSREQSLVCRVRLRATEAQS
jgi:3-hydroxyacyl-[acyl-carrier-protein] dehydratase